MDDLCFIAEVCDTEASVEERRKNRLQVSKHDSRVRCVASAPNRETKLKYGLSSCSCLSDHFSLLVTGILTPDLYGTGRQPLIVPTMD